MEDMKCPNKPECFETEIVNQHYDDSIRYAYGSFDKMFHDEGSEMETDYVLMVYLERTVEEMFRYGWSKKQIMEMVEERFSVGVRNEA